MVAAGIPGGIGVFCTSGTRDAIQLGSSHLLQGIRYLSSTVLHNQHRKYPSGRQNGNMTPRMFLGLSCTDLSSPVVASLVS